MMQQRTKMLAAIVLAAGIVYFILVPAIIWPHFPPEVAIVTPARGAFNQDLPIRITLSSWHANCRIRQVLWYRAYYGSPDPAPDEAQYPVVVYESSTGAGRWRANPLTWPRTYSVDVTLPLARLAGEHRVQPGTQHWKIDVIADYIPGLQRRGYILPQMPVPRRVAFPFEVQLD